MEPADPVAESDIRVEDPPVDAPGDATAPDDDYELIEEAAASPASTWKHPSIGRWIVFAAIAIGVVLLDQLAKSWIIGNLDIGESFEAIGDWLRIVHWRNSGILFGMLPQSAGAFAIVSLVVVGVIVFYHAKAGRGLVVTIALGLLLGGALGNLLDRLRHGSVIDFVDMGIGGWRFYTYNLADAAISTSIALLIAMAVFPVIADWAPDGGAPDD
jgi:signal peptidase II